MVDHLLEAYDAHVASGLSPDVAIQRSLTAFGDPQPIRREFLLRGLARDARAAVRLPRMWALFVVLDAAMAVIRPWAAGVASPIASTAAVASVTRYLVFSIALLWIGHSAFRLSWSLCRRFMQGPDVEWELATGLGVFAMGFGLLLWTGPGYAFPAICDLIDRSLGRDSAVALTTLAVGLSVSLAAVVRDLSRTTDQMHAS